MLCCKFCGAELSDDDRFCGFCGQTESGSEAGKDLWSISTNTVLKSGERQYQGIAKETIVFDKGRSSYTAPQYDVEELYPTILSRRSQESEVPTSYAEPGVWSPRYADPKTPPVDIGSWMQPASRRRSPVLILVTIAVVCAVIISGVIGFFLINIRTPPPVKLATLMVTPSTLDFGELEQSVKLTLPISISNTGGQRLSWSATADAGSTKWLAVQTRSATIEPKALQQKDNVTVDTIDLPPGPSFAYLTINSNGGKAQVTVKVDVIPPGSPKLNIIPTSLDFGTYAMAMPVPQQSIMVINGGTMVLKWQANAGNVRWLTLDKNSSTSGMLQSGGQQVINVAVNTGLTPGNYSATVTITSSNGGKQPVSVSLVVISPPPPQARLTVSPLSLNFGQLVASTTPTKQVIVNDTGRQPLNWTAIAQTAGGGSWLSIYDTGGTINPGDPSQTINVKVDATHLATGNYSGTVTITASGAQSSPTTVGITLTVVAPPQLTVTPTSLTFSNGVQGTPAPQQVTVRNTGGQGMTWTAGVQTASGGSWLSIDNHVGTINPGGSPQTINVTANTSNLSPGSYTATLNFTSNGGNAHAQVSLTINAPPPVIGVSPNPLDFGSVTSGQTAPMQEIVSNSGGQPLNWSLDTTSLPGWLSVDTSSDTVQPGSSQTITVTDNTSNLSPMSYTATLNFTSKGGNASVSVTLTVNASPPVMGVSPNSLDFGSATSGQTAILPETITNSGGQPLNWSLDTTSLPIWLSVDTSLGTVQPGNSQTITVTANTSNLSTGSNSATLNFTSSNGGGSAQVTVTIIVQ